MTTHQVKKELLKNGYYENDIPVPISFFIGYYEEAIYFHEKIMEIANYIHNISGARVFIYGGYIRNIIEYCFIKNTTPDDVKVNFLHTNDINIWLIFPKDINSIVWSEKRKQICEFLSCNYDLKVDISVFHDFKFIINDKLKFQINTRITDVFPVGFDSICDFSVNNLYMNLVGNIYCRVFIPNISIWDIFKSIKEKELVELFKYSIQKDVQQYQIEQMLIRYKKMIGYGYTNKLLKK